MRLKPDGAGPGWGEPEPDGMREATRLATSRPHTVSCCQMWGCRTQQRGPAGVLARAGGAPSPGAWSLRPRGLHGIRRRQPWGPHRFPRAGEAQRQALLRTPAPQLSGASGVSAVAGPSGLDPQSRVRSQAPPECGGSGEGPRFTL